MEGKVDADVAVEGGSASRTHKARRFQSSIQSALRQLAGGAIGRAVQAGATSNFVIALIRVVLFAASVLVAWILVLVGHLDYVIVFVLGGLNGAADLASRFRDSPSRALSSLPGLLFISLNGAASILALYLIQAFGWTFGAAGAGVEVMQVLVAGLAAVVLFRTSVQVRLGGTMQSVGLDRVTQAFLDAAEMAVDRLRAVERAREVAAVMRGVDFDKAWISLPSFAIALMQSVSQTDQVALGKNVGELVKGNQPKAVKSLLLGLLLMNLVGGGALRAAVDGLGNDVK
jgi:hypothetical protein